MPNAVRSLAYASEMSRTCSIAATAIAAIEIRSWRQVHHQRDEAGALLAEQVLLGHLDVVEEQLGGVLGLHADLVEVAAALEALHAALDDEQADALVAGVGVGAADHDHQVGHDAVADEGLRAVEHVVVALVDGRRADALQVAAGAGLGHRDRRDDLAADQAGQPALLLLVGPELRDVGDDDVAVHGEARAAGADLGHLLGHDRVVAEVLDPGAAVLLVDVEAEQPGLAGLDPDLAADLAVLLPLVVEGDDLLLEEGRATVARKSSCSCS